MLFQQEKRAKFVNMFENMDGKTDRQGACFSLAAVNEERLNSFVRLPTSATLFRVEKGST